MRGFSALLLVDSVAASLIATVVVAGHVAVVVTRVVAGVVALVVIFIVYFTFYTQRVHFLHSTCFFFLWLSLFLGVAKGARSLSLSLSIYLCLGPVLLNESYANISLDPALVCVCVCVQRVDLPRTDKKKCFRWDWLR